MRLIGKNEKCNAPAGEFIRGLSTGLADIGECERGDVVKLWCPPNDNRCMATAALRDGKDAPDPLALKLLTDRLADDKSNDAAAFVACDGTLHDSF